MSQLKCHFCHKEMKPPKEKWCSSPCQRKAGIEKPQKAKNKMIKRMAEYWVRMYLAKKLKFNVLLHNLNELNK